MNTFIRNFGSVNFPTTNNGLPPAGLVLDFIYYH